MRLAWATVNKFKSIEDSGRVDLEPNVTCFVGKNESGKTAFLEALYRLRPISPTADATFDGLRDYPRPRWSKEKANVPQVQPIHAGFELDGTDIRVLEDRFGAGVLPKREVVLTKTYAGNLSWAFEFDESAAVRHIIKTENLDTTLANSCKTVAGLVSNLEASDPASTTATSVAQKFKAFDLKTQLTIALEPRTPKFLYFSEYSQLPGRFSVPYVQGTNESQLDTQHRTALSFLRLAEVGQADFPQDRYEARKAALEAVAAAITTEVFEFWTQNKDLVVQVDLDFAPAGPPMSAQPMPVPPTPETPPFLDIRIFNPKHAVSINFSQRSSGFVWFFSFLVAFSEFRNSEHPLVLLLDEPGLGLHAAAQGDLLRLIDDRLASPVTKSCTPLIRPL